MTPEDIRGLLSRHRLATARELVFAIPCCLALFTLRTATAIPAMLAGAILTLTEGAVEGGSLKQRAWIHKLPLIGLPFLMLDQMLSERSVGMRALIIERLKHIRGKQVRAAFEAPSGVVLFLRDFQPKDSEVFEYSSPRGAVASYHHRDAYLFAGIQEASVPVVAIAVPSGGPPTNTSFCHLRLAGGSWLSDVERVARAATSILVAIPPDGHLGQLLWSRDMAAARNTLAQFEASDFEPRARGLAAEISMILEDSELRNKALVVNAYMDGQPYVTSTWLALRDFGHVETSDVKALMLRRA